jgi:hypothetical protein
VIELHSDKLPVALDLVRPCLLRVLGEVRLSIPYAAFLQRYTDAADSHSDNRDNFCDKAISLAYKFWLFRNVKHSPLLFSRQADGGR